VGEIAGSPFTMSCSGGSAPYDCTFDIVLGSVGSYSHQFEVTNRYGSSVTYPSRQEPDPTVYALPILDWCSGETNGVNPDDGDTNTNFQYCVRYTPTDGDDPNVYNPTLHIEDSTGPIAGSPFGMTCTGASAPYECTLDIVLGVADSYTHQFEVTNRYGSTVTFPTSAEPGPTVYALPDLTWCAGETNGVNPDDGDVNTNFQYCVRYTPTSGDDPNSFPPKVHIYQSGVGEIAGSPFTMSCSGSFPPYDCTHDTTLASGSYSHRFEVTNRYGSTVPFPTSPEPDPTVYDLPVLTWCSGWTDGVDPDEEEVSATFTYCIRYSQAQGQGPPGWP
jgi:hypothetical protein